MLTNGTGRAPRCAARRGASGPGRAAAGLLDQQQRRPHQFIRGAGWAGPLHRAGSSRCSRPGPGSPRPWCTVTRRRHLRHPRPTGRTGRHTDPELAASPGVHSAAPPSSVLPHLPSRGPGLARRQPHRRRAARQPCTAVPDQRGAGPWRPPGTGGDGPACRLLASVATHSPLRRARPPGSATSQAVIIAAPHPGLPGTVPG